MARRTHKMIAARSNVSDNGVMSPSTSMTAPCCKHFWLMDEESPDTTITDAKGGVVVTPNAIAFDGPAGTVKVRFSSSIGVGQTAAPTAGSFAELGTKDFIVFAVKRYFEDVSRGNDYLFLKDTTLPRLVGYFDGDGFRIADGDANPHVCGTETFAGQDYPDEVYTQDCANALVRNGQDFGMWCDPQALMPNQENLIGDDGEFSDIFVRLPRGDGYYNSVPGEGFITADYGRNDYNVPQYILDDWKENFGAGGRTVTYTDYLNLVEGIAGIKGVWVDSQKENYDMGTPNEIQFSAGLSAGIIYYGVCIFVFDNGLPSDFKQALRWMREQWLAGNKVIWPKWVSVA